MKYHENHQKRVLGVIIAVSSKNKLFLGVWSPPKKNMAVAHLDPMWPPSAQNPGGMWVLMCVWGVCVGAQGCEMLAGLGGGGLITLIMFYEQ